MPKEIKNVYDLLRTTPSKLEIFEGFGSVRVGEKLPHNLPVASSVQQAEDAVFTPKKDKPLEKRETASREKAPEEERHSILDRDYVKYPLIFVVSFAFFYFFLNFGAFSNKISSYFSKQEMAPQTEGQVLGVVTPEYASWINKYFYQTNNNDNLSPNVDFDKDGLTNYQEFLLGTNPTKRDTDNDNYIDGQEILNGYNPLYQGKLTDRQKEIIDEWDLREVNNRISYYAVTRLAQGPIKPSSLPVINYDLTRNGELSIPKLGIKAPLIWSKSPENFDDDLDRGVIHYPGTSLPGQAGVSYVSGHSSNFVWRQSPYSFIFSRLNELEEGDEFFVTVPKADGSRLNLRYVVFAKNKYKPDDQAQFLSDGLDSIVNLSTCWPIGSLAERYVVSGRLTGI